MTNLLIANAIVFLFFGIIWSKNGASNLFIKVSCWALGIANGLALLDNLGYMVKM